LDKFKALGFKAEELKNVGKFSVGQLKAAGFSLLEFKNSNFDITELKKAGFELKDFKNAGYKLKDIKDLFNDTNNTKSIINYKNAGFELTELKDVGYKINELINSGFKLMEFKNLGIEITEFINNNISFYEMFTELGYTYGHLENLYKEKIKKENYSDTKFDEVIKNCKKMFMLNSKCIYDTKQQKAVIPGGNKKSRKIIKKINKKSIRGCGKVIKYF
jgi:biotin operon repressor